VASTAVAATLCAGLVTGSSTAAPATDPDLAAESLAGPVKQWVMGYYVAYQISRYPIASIDWSGMTHVAFGSIEIGSDLSVVVGPRDQYGTGEADAKALVKAAHAHGVKGMLMLGGSGDADGANLATAARPANRPTTVKRLLATMDRLGYDGIDLDWETHLSVPDATGLAQDLRKARPSMLLTFAAGAINPNIGGPDPGLVALAKSVNRFSIMSYYPSTAWAGDG
jgi:GH18 family chitinase